MWSSSKGPNKAFLACHWQREYRVFGGCCGEHQDDSTLLCREGGMRKPVYIKEQKEDGGSSQMWGEVCVYLI